VSGPPLFPPPPAAGQPCGPYPGAPSGPFPGVPAIWPVSRPAVGPRSLRAAARSRHSPLPARVARDALLYLDLAAATALYDYLTPAVGLLLAMLVSSGGLWLADRWRSLLLACGAIVAAALLAPVVTEGAVPLLVALVLVLQAAATVVALHRMWPVLVGIAAVWPVLYGTAVAGVAAPPDHPVAAATSLGVLLVGLATAVWASRRDPVPLPRGLLIGLLVASPVPALTFAAAVDGWAGATLAYVTAVLLFAAAALPNRDDVVRLVALAAGAVALFEATAVALEGRGDHRSARAGGGAGGGRGEPALAPDADGRRLDRGVRGDLGAGRPRSSGGVDELPVGAVHARDDPAAGSDRGGDSRVGAGARRRGRGARRGGADRRASCGRPCRSPLGPRRSRRPVRRRRPGDRARAPDRALWKGFVTGHALVTLSWTVVAAVLLARGVRRPAMRVAGMVLVAAAVAKLILFDLVALDGLARVAAFLGAGLLLLAAGTRYARLVAEAEPAAVEEESPRG
jgi:uncharacterized membrane protein